MDFDQALALADRLFVTACRGNLSGEKYRRARHLWLDVAPGLGAEMGAEVE